MNGISTSKQLDFRNIRFNAGVEGLHGCTSVIVIAKRAIWMSHFWEIPGFPNVVVDPNTNLVTHNTETPITNTQFRNRVLNFFRFWSSTLGQARPREKETCDTQSKFSKSSQKLADRKAIVKVWVQGDQVEGDITWDPLANQLKRSLFRRQDQGACAEPEEPTTMTTLPSPSPTSVNNPPPPPETETPTPAEPTQAPLTPAEPNVFKIRIHQQMEHKTSSVEWTLLDSNEQTVAGPDTTSTIPGSSGNDIRSEVQIDVESPTNKDETRITFTMKTDVGGGCMPSWDMARSSGSETSFVAACNPALADAKAYGCDDPKKVGWQPLNAGFERTFMCWWLDVSKATVGLR
ncbi:hypothetical protein K432DRAFT_399111 [Lepidopterella palustris CBS 459.81]|uniref:Uncharacterized protein n=1 Tax=Lepidopterella palustris CBS 459.81 TaxID=1314670 RepID=A0A8E2DWM9_9PEZI|nr:hypothetical protein K432DRAFT_399111 [Lepidopterella palustris CBS 459.81]